MLFILLSFPTRRSSDLVEEEVEVYVGLCLIEPRVEAAGAGVAVPVDIAQLIARLVGAKVVELEALARFADRLLPHPAREKGRGQRIPAQHPPHPRVEEAAGGSCRLRHRNASAPGGGGFPWRRGRFR